MANKKYKFTVEVEIKEEFTHTEEWKEFLEQIDNGEAIAEVVQEEDHIDSMSVTYEELNS